MRRIRQPVSFIACGLLIGSMGCSMSTIAHAQEANPADDSDGIVVTARKREETLTSVPASIDVVTTAAIESKGIVNTSDLIGRLPGLSTSSDINSPGRDFLSLVIRGVGANAGGGDPAAPVFVDGKKMTTLRGPNIAAEFQQIVEDYIERRFGGSAASPDPVPARESHSA